MCWWVIAFPSEQITHLCSPGYHRARWSHSRHLFPNLATGNQHQTKAAFLGRCTFHETHIVNSLEMTWAWDTSLLIEIKEIVLWVCMAGIGVQKKQSPQNGISLLFGFFHRCGFVCVISSRWKIIKVISQWKCGCTKTISGADKLACNEGWLCSIGSN